MTTNVERVLAIKGGGHYGVLALRDVAHNIHLSREMEFKSSAKS